MKHVGANHAAMTLAAAAKFLLYLKAEKNCSAHTFKAYEHDLKEFYRVLGKLVPRTGGQERDRPLGGGVQRR